MLWMTSRVFLPILLLMGLLAASDAHAATFTVSKTADTNDGTCDADCSLREAINAANTNGGPNTVAFNIPFVDPGYNAGTGVFTINVGTPLPAITGINTTIDGTTQATNNGDSNPLILGSGGIVGLGPDAVAGTGDEVTLSQVAGPEIEIRGVVGFAYGLHIQANGVTIRGLAILGFGSADGDGCIRVDSFVNAMIEQNIIGSPADSFGDPGAAARCYVGVHSENGGNGTVQDNLVGFAGARDIWLTADSQNWTIQRNEIRDGGLSSNGGDGMSINASSGNTIAQNLIIGSGSQGFVVTGSVSNDNQLIDNTITANGIGTTSGVTQSNAVALRPTAGPTLVERNIINANYGAGLQVNSGATGIRITQNSFFDNGTIVARDGSPPTGQIGIDLNAAGDNDNFGTPPFYTINDSGDGDSGANNLLNFPILDMASIAAGNLTLTGWARPGSVIEVFVAAPDPSGFGEGQTYLVTLIEGSGADNDATSSSYGPGPINGLAQGTDNTNRFSFTIPTPAGVTNGTPLTATATVSTDTSEFSGSVNAISNLEIVKGAYLPDGTPIPSGATMPEGVQFFFVLYVNNRGGARSDVSLRDVLDSAFTYQPGSILFDNSVAACAAAICTPAEKAAIVSAVMAGSAGTDAVDGDAVSYTGASLTVDAGDTNAGNQQLDIGANLVYSIAFLIKMQ